MTETTQEQVQKGYMKVATLHVRYLSPYRRNKLDKKQLRAAVENGAFDTLTILCVDGISCSSAKTAQNMGSRI